MSADALSRAGHASLRGRVLAFANAEATRQVKRSQIRTHKGTPLFVQKRQQLLKARLMMAEHMDQMQLAQQQYRWIERGEALDMQALLCKLGQLIKRCETSLAVVPKKRRCGNRLETLRATAIEQSG